MVTNYDSKINILIMEKEELEQGIGYAVPVETYDIVNEVYLDMEFFICKQQVYDFWATYGIQGFLSMRKDLEVKRDLQREVANLTDENGKLMSSMKNIAKIATWWC